MHLLCIAMGKIIRFLKCILFGCELLLFLQELAGVIVISSHNGLFCITLHLRNLFITLIQLAFAFCLLCHHSCSLSFYLSKITFQITQILIYHLLRVLCLVQ